MNSTYKDLKAATSICTMSHESVADQAQHAWKLEEQTQMVEAGLITFAEAKRAVFGN